VSLNDPASERAVWSRWLLASPILCELWLQQRRRELWAHQLVSILRGASLACSTQLNDADPVSADARREGGWCEWEMGSRRSLQLHVPTPSVRIPIVYGLIRYSSWHSPGKGFVFNQKGNYRLRDHVDLVVTNMMI
jgi:hypothetical protein